MRLEQENDDLAHELVTSKIALRNDLDQVNVSFTRLKSDRDDLFKGTDRVALSAVPLGLTLYLRLSWLLVGRRGGQEVGGDSLC